MTIFRVPDDFPLISLALASPLVQTGDTILVKEGAGQEVTAVPPDKSGIRILADEDSPDPALVPEKEFGDEVTVKETAWEEEFSGGVVVRKTAWDDGYAGIGGTARPEAMEDEDGFRDGEEKGVTDADDVPPEETVAVPDIGEAGGDHPDNAPSEPAVPWLGAEDSGELGGEVVGGPQDNAPSEAAVPGLGAEDSGELGGEVVGGPQEDTPVADSGGIPESGDQTPKAILTVTGAGAQMFRASQGPGYSYWVIIRRHK